MHPANLSRVRHQPNPTHDRPSRRHRGNQETDDQTPNGARQAKASGHADQIHARARTQERPPAGTKHGYEPIETPRGRVITDEIPIAEPRSTSAVTTPSQNKEPRDAPPNESSAVPPSESTDECEIRGSRAAGQTFGSMHAGTVAPPPGSGHAEPSGLSDEKRTRPRPGTGQNLKPGSKSGEIHRRFARGRSMEQSTAVEGEGRVRRGRGRAAGRWWVGV